MNKSLLCVAACVCLGAALRGADASPDSGKFVFNLLPRSLQKRPVANFNVITEMTNEGRSFVAKKGSSPAYYLTKPGAFVQLGHGAARGDQPPKVERMEEVMEHALKMNGYLPAEKGHPPTVVVVYSWGSHSSPFDEEDPGQGTISNEVLVNEMVERARLVGGEKFTTDLIRAMAQEGSAKRATYKPRSDTSGTGFGDASNVRAQPNIAGDASNAMTRIFSPVEHFRHRNDKTNELMGDVTGSIFFVIASAYDFASATTNRKILLWRTKMTVNSSGIAMVETLPAMIAVSGPYLGREMSETEVITKHLIGEGRVEIGTPVVKEEESPVTPPASQTPAGATKPP